MFWIFVMEPGYKVRNDGVEYVVEIWSDELGSNEGLQDGQPPPVCGVFEVPRLAEKGQGGLQVTLNRQSLLLHIIKFV